MCIWCDQSAVQRPASNAGAAAQGAGVNWGDEDAVQEWASELLDDMIEGELGMTCGELGWGYRGGLTLVK